MKKAKRNLMSLALMVCMIFLLVPAKAYAEEADTTKISDANCTVIGDNEGTPMYYFDIADGSKTVEFVDYADSMEEGSMCGLFYTGYADGTNIVDLEDGFAITSENLFSSYGDYLDEDACNDLDFSNIYGVFLMDDDYNCVYYIIHADAEDPQDPVEDTFSVSIDGEEIDYTTITKTENAYAYYDYMAGTNVYVDLFKVPIPCDTTEVTLNTSIESLFYNYNGTGSYLAGWVDDYTKGADEITVKVDSNNDKELDFIQVQNPYNADYSGGELRYAITFEYKAHTPVHVEEKAASCETAGNVEYWTCDTCDKTFSDAACSTEISPDLVVIPATGHDYQETITKAASYTEKGIKTFTCKNDSSHTYTQEIEKLVDTSVQNYFDVATVESLLASTPGESDPTGSQFQLLCAKVSKVANTSQTITWNAIPNATGYIIYGNICGATGYNKLANIESAATTSYTVQPLIKGTAFKYLVVAVRNGKVLSISKTIHACTSGGKNTNYTSVKVNKKKVSLKPGKTFKIKASGVKKGKLKVKNHRKMAFESSNPAVATVSAKGKIKAIAKGTCYVYAYACNGVYKAIKVTVK